MKKKSNNYLKRLVPYAMPYKKYAILNVVSNVFHALFSTMSFVVLMPMLNIMFDSTEQIKVRPVLQKTTGFFDFFDTFGAIFP